MFLLTFLFYFVDTVLFCRTVFVGRWVAKTSKPIYSTNGREQFIYLFTAGIKLLFNILILYFLMHRYYLDIILIFNDGEINK